MAEGTAWHWAGLLLLGAYHGINPGMGWLFAVALGMQERRSRAVWFTLLPLATGHALAIGAVVAVALLAGMAVPHDALRWPVAGILVALGAYRLVRNRHPRWGGMRVGFGDLTIWSFLMASAHGAGLMVLPLLLGMAGTTAQAAAVDGFAVAAMAQQAASTPPVVAVAAMAQQAAPTTPVVAVAATLVHTAGYLLVTGVVALLVYEKLGLALLRRAWVNLDLIWAVALIVSGVVALVM